VSIKKGGEEGREERVRRGVRRGGRGREGEGDANNP